MRYEELPPLSRDEALQRLESADPDVLTTTIAQIALNDGDADFIQDVLARFMQHPAPFVRSVAARCVGDLARRHKQLDRQRIVPLLERLLRDPETADAARDGLEDVDIYS